MSAKHDEPLIVNYGPPSTPKGKLPRKESVVSTEGGTGTHDDPICLDETPEKEKTAAASGILPSLSENPAQQKLDGLRASARGSKHKPTTVEDVEEDEAEYGSENIVPPGLSANEYYKMYDDETLPKKIR